MQTPSWLELQNVPSAVLRVKYPAYFSEWEDLFRKSTPSDYDFVGGLFPHDEVELAANESDDDQMDDIAEQDLWSTVTKKVHVPMRQSGNGRRPQNPYQSGNGRRPQNPYQSGNGRRPQNPYQSGNDRRPQNPYQSGNDRRPQNPYQYGNVRRPHQNVFDKRAQIPCKWIDDCWDQKNGECPYKH
jgi:hypothetical protein